MSPKIVGDLFQQQITKYFEVTEVKRFPKPAPQPARKTIFVFDLANSERKILQFTRLPPRTRLSDHLRTLA
ncbi:hypothetical protein V5O48_007095 [Marasmius crinis-equi]|uniref:Uncharacterized protein n=1 Tax=Marasmius crinis-equi TaxID=585013 RepID=A0ABR3FHM1_9AGAR